VHIGLITTQFILLNKALNIEVVYFVYDLAFCADMKTAKVDVALQL
jgi:hypothetical protein